MIYRISRSPVHSEFVFTLRAKFLAGHGVLFTRTHTNCVIAAIQFSFHAHFVVESQWVNPDELRNECGMDFV